MLASEEWLQANINELASGVYIMIAKPVEPALKFAAVAHDVNHKVWNLDQSSTLLHQVVSFVQKCQLNELDREDGAFEAEAVLVQSDSQNE